MNEIKNLVRYYSQIIEDELMKSTMKKLEKLGCNITEITWFDSLEDEEKLTIIELHKHINNVPIIELYYNPVFRETFKQVKEKSEQNKEYKYYKNN